MDYAVISYSHKNVGLENLYRYDIEPSALKGLDADYMILKTCNRIELYLCCGDPHDTVASLKRMGVGVDDEHDTFIGKDAARHALKVASGLESIVVGENEILGQFNKSFLEQMREGHMKRGLDKLLKKAVYTGRKARTETGISRGKRGTYSLAIDYLGRVYDGGEMAIIGSGDEARRFLNGFSVNHRINGIVMSRNPLNAKSLAENFGLKYGTLDDNKVEGYKFVFCAYKGNETITVNGAEYAVDISVPVVLSGKNVTGIEELRKLSAVREPDKEAEVRKCESVVEKELNEFLNRTRSS